MCLVNFIDGFLHATFALCGAKTIFFSCDTNKVKFNSIKLHCLLLCFCFLFRYYQDITACKTKDPLKKSQKNFHVRDFWGSFTKSPDNETWVLIHLIHLSETTNKAKESWENIFISVKVVLNPYIKGISNLEEQNRNRRQ